MKTLVEVTIEKDTTDDDDNPQYERSQWWLLHWGLQYQLIEGEDHRMIPVNYTVAICENYNNGEVRCFMPEQLRILGKEVKS